MNDIVKIELENVPTSRETVEAFQKAISTLPQAELETNHYFANGMYCREVHRKAGTIIVGKVHKQEHFFMCTKGQINVWTENGVVEMKAGKIIVSQPGTKRVTYAVEDSTGVTIHQVTSRNLDEIEREVVEYDENALFDAQNAIKSLGLEKL